MSGRMEGKRYPADLPPLPVRQRLDPNVAKPVAQNGRGERRGKVTVAAAPGMVRMGMGDHGTVHRPPGVYVEAALGAEYPGIGKGKERVAPHA